MKDKKSPAEYNRSSAIIAWLCLVICIAIVVIEAVREGRAPGFAAIAVLISLLALSVAATVSAWRSRGDTTPREYEELDPYAPPETVLPDENDTVEEEDSGTDDKS